MIEYKLLKDYHKGLLITRQPQVIHDNVALVFIGAPERATAIMRRKSDGMTLYRELENNACTVYEDFLQGDIEVRVTVLDGTIEPIFICDELKASPIDTGILISPNDINLHNAIYDLQLNMQALYDVVEDYKKSNDLLRDMITSLKAENVRLSEAFNKAIEVINNLSERIVALEKNYDPTIIN